MIGHGGQRKQGERRYPKPTQWPPPRDPEVDPCGYGREQEDDEVVAEAVAEDVEVGEDRIATDVRRAEKIVGNPEPECAGGNGRDDERQQEPHDGPPARLPLDPGRLQITRLTDDGLYVSDAHGPGGLVRQVIS